MNQGLISTLIYFILVGIFGSSSYGQDSFLTSWNAAKASQPAVINFTISAPSSRFILGEAIPLTFSFTASQPDTFRVNAIAMDRIGRLNWLDEFILDPASEVVDPLEGLPGGSGGFGGISGVPPPLSDAAFEMARTLNEWVRFRKPGHYRLYVRSRRVSPVFAEQSASPEALRRDDRIPLVSNILSIEIAPAPPGWTLACVAEAEQVLNDRQREPHDDSYFRNREKAVATLRFLDTQEATEAMLRHLGDTREPGMHALYRGLLASDHRPLVLAGMAARLTDPRQAVWPQYLETLAYVAELVASGGPQQPYPEAEDLRAPWLEENKRRKAIIASKREDYIQTLLRAIPAKQPQARAISARALLEIAQREGRMPAWWELMHTTLVGDFQDLPERIQAELLADGALLPNRHSLLPLLVDLYDRPIARRGTDSVHDFALRRMLVIAPAEGRKRVVEELRTATRSLSWSTLSMLPDETLPELDEVFAGQAETGFPDGRLVVRYASGAIVERVKRGYLLRKEMLAKQNLPECGSPLIFYFLKHDPSFGEQELRSAFAAEQSYRHCYDLGHMFRDLGGFAYSPALERLAIEHLNSPKVPVKRGAAEILGKYGSENAKDPLWESLAYFHKWWEGKEDHLDSNPGYEGSDLEMALVNALGQAEAWVLRPTELEKLESLCSSNSCRTLVEQWRRSEGEPVFLHVYGREFRAPYAGGLAASVGRYQVRTEEGLTRKIAQFPDRTTFRLAPEMRASHDPQLVALAERIEEIIRFSGRRLVDE